MRAKDLIPRRLLDNLYEGVYFVDLDRRIIYWNRAAESITGYSKEEVVGRSCGDDILNHIDGSGTRLCLGQCPLARTLKDETTREAEIYLHHKDGHRIPVLARVGPLTGKDGTLLGAVEVFIDNSSYLDVGRRIKELERQALMDQLTELPNRRFIEEEIKSRLAELERYGWPFGMLFFDIDHFKSVNDTHGHLVGDQVLRMVSRTLRANARPFDLIGRWGGEEFLGLIRNVDPGALCQIGERYRSLVRESKLFREPEPIGVTISVGAALARAGDSLDSLLQRADRNLYFAKTEGRDRVTCDYPGLEGSS